MPPVDLIRQMADRRGHRSKSGRCPPSLRQDRDLGVVAMKPIGGEHIGFDQFKPAPTWSASVETDRSIPSHLKRWLCRFNG